MEPFVRTWARASGRRKVKSLVEREMEVESWPLQLTNFVAYSDWLGYAQASGRRILKGRPLGPSSGREEVARAWSCLPISRYYCRRFHRLTTCSTYTDSNDGTRACGPISCAYVQTQLPEGTTGIMATRHHDDMATSRNVVQHEFTLSSILSVNTIFDLCIPSPK